MSRLEIKDLSKAAGKGAAAAENLAAGEPPGEYDVIGLWYVKVLPVHFLDGQLNIIRNVFRDRMGRRRHKEPLPVPMPPFQSHGSPEQLFHDLAAMRGMQCDQSHAV